MSRVPFLSGTVGSESEASLPPEKSGGPDDFPEQLASLLPDEDINIDGTHFYRGSGGLYFASKVAELLFLTFPRHQSDGYVTFEELANGMPLPEFSYFFKTIHLDVLHDCSVFHLISAEDVYELFRASGFRLFVSVYLDPKRVQILTLVSAQIYDQSEKMMMRDHQQGALEDSLPSLWQI